MKQPVLIAAVSTLLLLNPATQANPARTEFAAPFAPAEEWVKPSEKPYRKGLCLNGTWQFQPVALPEKFKENQDPAPELTAPKADGWEKTPIRIPSPWNINNFSEHKGLGCDLRSYPSYPKEWENVKMGWLRKTFTVPADWKGTRIQLHFSAVAGDAQVLVNGKKVGSHFGIFFPFDVDITDAVVPGKEAELLVGVRKPSLLDKRGEYGRRPYQGGSFWGQHIVGIWDDVNLVSVPAVRVVDTYIKPLVDADTLETEVTLRNDSSKEVEVTLGADAYPWISKAGKDIITAPNPSSELGKKAALKIAGASVKVPANGEAKATLSSKVKNQLKLWSPEQPNLYGLVVQPKVNGKAVDSKYTRFGWRQFTLQGTQYLLNGKPIWLKGDSWHFMGIPQMTRRYPWAWFKTMRDANLNAVRLHAQPYPSFYLDVADEVGMLVLDETAIWASDGGPKLDSDEFWKDTENHVADLVQRDRNHPSIFGWSVSNEVHPIVVNVFRNPPGMLDKLKKHYGIWAEVCRKNDATRPWISADGEDDGEGQLPTYVVHYGGTNAMQRGFKSGKPWGVGEAGNAYYGTPEQVSEANGDRAYESFQGRMEGVASSSYTSLMQQYENKAVYRSVFNMIWYALKPLALGMKDTTRPPTLEDGVFFTSFVEGKPGVQPERLGPYSTTVNPGYDPSLALYETWPLFDAIRDASSQPPVPCKWQTTPPKKTPAPAPSTKVASVKVLSGAGGKLAADLKQTGVPLAKLETESVPEVLFIDGANPPGPEAKAVIDQVLANKGTVFVLGANSKGLEGLNALLPAPIELTQRSASSLLQVTPSPITAGLGAADLYFSELMPPEIITQGITGPLVEQSAVLLKACDTDWLKWNKQPENGKTAMILRTEREAKPAGNALIAKKQGEGTLLVTTMPAAPRLGKQEKAVRAILTNLGLPLVAGRDSGKPLLKTGEMVRALMCGSFPVESVEKAPEKNPVDPAKGEVIKANVKVEDKPWKMIQSESGKFDFHKLPITGQKDNAVAYLSFWVSSPRDLTDLLIEPNIPKVTLEVAADDALQVWLNGKEVVKNIRSGPIEGGKAKSEPLKLRQGWNHFLIKVIQGGGGWQFTGRLNCDQPDFVAELESALEKP